MPTHLSVETISNDNQKSLFKSKRLKLNGKEFVTPSRALDPSKFRSDIELNKKAYGLNEIYRNLDSDKITTLQKDANEHDDFARILVNHTKRAQLNDLNLCIVRYSTKRPNPLPTKKEVEFLTDVAHSFSDITPLPIIDVKIDASNFPRYLDCLKDCYDTIEELNNKPIMGILPNLPPELYSKLLEFYLKNDISSFYVDFDGKTPNHLKLRPILRFLNTKKMLGKSLIYGVNAKPGRPLKNTNVIPSKDFIAYGYGLDVLGESHIGAKMPKEFFEKMKKAISDQQQNKKRIFIKNDYGYYKTADRSGIKSIYPSDTKIKLDRIFDESQTTWQKLFNMEQQGIEAATIRKRLNSLDRNETILSYLKKKKQIKKEMKHLESGLKAISQQTLI